METVQTESLKLDCSGCGASLNYAPGTMNLQCQYCGSKNEIEVKEEAIQETHYKKFLKQRLEHEPKLTITLVKCGGCSAEVSLKENVTSDLCPFCGTGIVITGGSKSEVLKPKYMLPFSVDKHKAEGGFKTWISKLWFAPNDLKKYVKEIDRLNGMYIPYWTYDCDTGTHYKGERGDDEYDYEYDDKGRSRRVKKTVWRSVSGHVHVKFDDLLVMASPSLPEKYARKLEPWDLKSLIPFDEKFLSGMRSETYQLGIEDGLDVAKTLMEAEIKQAIRKDIRGDHQRIHSKETTYSNVTFKYILLPVWLSAFRYNGKVYRFMINGRTGEVQGERPYSWIKIGLLVLLAAGLILAGIQLYHRYV